MKRFLSIDWDFFVDATMTQRLVMFPDGGNESLGTTFSNYIWDTLYRNPELQTIKVSTDYKKLLKICEEYYGQCLITDSHKHIFDLIMDNTTFNEEFEVYNIDFHHDMYNYRTGKEKINCGNWGSILKNEDRPNMKFFWIKREDSDTRVIGDVEVDAKLITMGQLTHKFNSKSFSGFDFLFMCRSSVWSPPHLDKYFVKVVEELMNHCPVSYEIGIDEPRPYDSRPLDIAEEVLFTKLKEGAF